MRVRRPGRGAFTLIEVVVALSLTMVIMLIIMQAFGAASKTFSTMRTAGQLQERMRGASMMLRRDLSAEHFDGPFVAGRGGPHVGDQRLDLPGWVPPPKGYFEIRQLGNVNAPTTFEPVFQSYLANGTARPMTDGEGLPSSRADTHVLRFTVHLPDLPAAELFVAGFQTSAQAQGPTEPTDLDGTINGFPVGTGLVFSRWAEVEYFLVPNGDSTPATSAGPGLPLYSLRRRVRVLAAGGQGRTYLVASQARAQFLILSYPDLGLMDLGPGPQGKGELLRALGPEDVTNPNYRVQLAQPASKYNANTNSMAQTGDDLLANDILSFEVKAAWFSNSAFNGLRNGSSPGMNPTFNPNNGRLINGDFPFDDIPPSVLNTGAWFGTRTFDTWYRDTQFDQMDWDRPLPARTTNEGFTAGIVSRNQFQVPVRINVRTLQIKIRIWDSQKNQARQATVVQEI